jgi:O-antigen ligase
MIKRMGKRSKSKKLVSCDSNLLNEECAKWLRWAVVAMVAIFPLVLIPGIERPFSTPKIYLLGGFVVIAGACAIGACRRGWPALPRGFRLSLIAWPCALSVSALSGEFVSLEALWLSLFSIGWFLLVVTLRPNPLHIAMGVAAACAVITIIALLQYVGLDPFRLFGWTTPLYGSPRMRVIGTAGNPNFVAAILVAGMPLSITLGTLLKRRILFTILSFIEIAAVFATGSRAAILALAVVLLWLVAIKRFANLRMMALGVLIIFSLLPFMPSRPLMTTIDGRLYIWRVTSGHLLDRPLFGYGPGGFEPKYIEWETNYWRDGRGSADERGFASLQAHAHDDYLETLVDGGLACLVSLLSLLSSFLVFVFHRAREPGGELVTGASAGVVSLAAVALVDFPLHRPTELFLLWTLMALAFLANKVESGQQRSAID